MEISNTSSSSRRWDSQRSARDSQWLDSTLSDLDKRMKDMLTLIQDDGDSFAQRAEMYYKKRPELLRMVEDFHRSHRCLAERYHQLRSEYMQMARSTSSISSDSLKHSPQDIQSKNLNGNHHHCSQELLDSNPESTVEDPNLDQDDAHTLNLDLSKTSETMNGKLQIPSSRASNVEAGAELRRFLDEENKSSGIDFNISTVFEGLVRGNEEKRETIKELHSRINNLMEERKILFSSWTSRKESQSRTSRLKGLILGKFRGVSSPRSGQFSSEY